jgi:two-component system LytT family response regulator
MNQPLFKAVLIDDESKALDVLSYLLKATGKVEVIAKETNPNMGLRQVMIHQPDLVFMDIDMPEKNGLEVLKELNELQCKSKVIVVSAHDEFVFEAFKNSAIDFLLKPVMINDLNQLMVRLLNNIGSQKTIRVTSDESQKLKFITGNTSVFLYPKEIIFFKADGNYTCVITTDGKERLLTAGVGKVEQILTTSFVRISRSIIINTQYLAMLVKGKRLCVLKHNEEEYQLKASVNNFYELERQFS